MKLMATTLSLMMFTCLSVSAAAPDNAAGTKENATPAQKDSQMSTKKSTKRHLAQKRQHKHSACNTASSKTK